MNPAEPYGDRPRTGIDFFVVGLGASAGGIEALQEFFAHVPANSGMAYVVILHLSPDHDSQLAEILQSVAFIPVTRVIEQTRVVPDHVYVIPPNQHLTMHDGFIAVTPNTHIEERRAPVDIFFRTLADALGPRAVCVVLSGTGANGSMGLKRVKELGGAAFVQSPREAAWSEMPRNAIATDLVDDVLSVAQIPARIVAYQANLGVVTIPVEADQRPDVQQQALRDVFTHLRLRTGHDFSNYKRPTLLRRIERRINVRNLPDLPTYAAYLRSNPDETQALLKDLLISVTNFFRDRNAFDVLDRDVVPRLFNGKPADAQVRVWVVGCATGEEAYSIAMLCAEHVRDAVDKPAVQIFATDIDEAALAQARDGLYTINDAADVPPERLRRYFTKENDSYRVQRDIREMVLFANHNVLKDPPFSHLDLVTCRNLLIYFNHTAQERALETLHFALNPGGYLFLGGSESVDGAGHLYASVSREHHIFQSRQTRARSYPVPDSVPTLRVDPSRLALSAEQERRRHDRVTYGDLHQRLLERYAAPSLVVDEDYDIVHLSERAGRYLQIGGGEPSNNLLKLIRPELRLDLRTALFQAAQRRTNVEAKNLKIRIDDRPETVTIHVRPVLRDNDPARGFLLVLFEPGSDSAPDTETVFRSDEPVAQQLEEELLRVKAQLRASSEQYELQTEELKATNEELQAMNEELRSAAEELETSKEELQSINEELRTVNQELKVKVEETTLASNNLQNLINSTDIGTIFLDRGLRVNLFTPATRELFNLIAADTGRPLSDITHRLANANVIADAEIVLSTLQTVERELATTDNRMFLMRALPYRTAEDRINGVVLTFMDITDRKLVEEQLRRAADLAAFRVRLTDALRPLSDPVDIQAEATRVLGEHLRADRVMYAEVVGEADDLFVVHRDYRRPEVPTAVGRHRFDDYGAYVAEKMRDGVTLNVADVLAMPEHTEANLVVYQTVAIRAYIAVPLVKGNRIAAYLAVNQQTPREWTPQEVALVEETAERTWTAIERARAEETVQRARDELELRVRERTAELVTANQALQQEIAERRRVEAQRTELLQQFITAQEDERRRVARELHDQLGQSVTALRLSLGRLTSASDDQIDAMLGQVKQLAAELDTDLSRLAFELRPSMLDDLGLVAAMQQHVERWSERTGIAVKVQVVGPDLAAITPEVAVVMYQVTQEALTNVLKHANARHVSVVLQRSDDELRLSVEDDGRGFDADAVQADPAARPGLGLLGMRERVAIIGGTVTLESTPGTGATVFVRVPTRNQAPGGNHDG